MCITRTNGEHSPLLHDIRANYTDNESVETPQTGQTLTCMLTYPIARLTLRTFNTTRTTSHVAHSPHLSRLLQQPRIIEVSPLLNGIRRCQMASKPTILLIQINHRTSSIGFRVPQGPIATNVSLGRIVRTLIPHAWHVMLHTVRNVQSSGHGPDAPRITELNCFLRRLHICVMPQSIPT